MHLMSRFWSMLWAMFERTLSIVYWTGAAAAVLALAWLCLANLPWLAAAFVFALALVVAGAALAPVWAAAAAVIAGAITAVAALIRAALRRRAA